MEKIIKIKLSQLPPREGGQPIDEPCELGYFCPHGHTGEVDTTWSEYKYCIWCRKCDREYLFFQCLRGENNWCDWDFISKAKLISEMAEAKKEFYRKFKIKKSYTVELVDDVGSWKKLSKMKKPKTQAQV